MGECKLDHSLEDVRNKLTDQIPFLPKELATRLEQFLQAEKPQATLNELFHLLKKYDLAPAEDQAERNRQLADFVD